MTSFDWLILALTLSSTVGWGLYKSRGTSTLQGYLLAGRSMRWYAVAFSIMATQASAITFTSTPGQAYADGMRFVQYYFGLPIAMVILSVTAVPLLRRLKVYTAYEYLEHRFDLKTRTLTSAIFMVQRGLGAGMTIYAPSLILSVMLGWDARITSAVIGGAIIIYTTTGGVKSVSWTHLQQLSIVMLGMVVAFVVAVTLLPADVSYTDALRVAGGLGRLNVVDFSFDWTNRYTFWSGIIGGMLRTTSHRPWSEITRLRSRWSGHTRLHSPWLPIMQSRSLPLPITPLRSRLSQTTRLRSQQLLAAADSLPTSHWPISRG